MTVIRLSVLLLALAGCASAPVDAPPPVAVPVAFKEAPDAAATWAPAAPADAVDRGPWWQAFDDPVLDALIGEVEVANQNVAAAAAAYAQAQALVRQQDAARLPALTANAGATRSGGDGAGSPGTRLQLGVGASWEPDVWGRLRLGTTSARASADARAALLASARLSAQAALAINYVTLREADHRLALLDAAIAAYERARRITTNQYNAAIAQRTDVLQAETQLATTRANRSALAGERARLEHAIALLMGRTPSELSIAVAPWDARVPAVPRVLPSALLQRRPDIAAAERAVAAANAQIGIERSAFFPNLGLTASVGNVGSTVSSLLNVSNTVWSLGLSVAQQLFDGGATRARVAGAEAARDEAVAAYRQSVLVAFQVVEDQLATMRTLAEQEDLRRAASSAADRAEQLTLNQYLQGLVPYTTVVTTQITALTARQTLSQLLADRQIAAIALIQALGGGWQAP